MKKNSPRSFSEATVVNFRFVVIKSPNKLDTPPTFLIHRKYGVGRKMASDGGWLPSERTTEKKAGKQRCWSEFTVPIFRFVMETPQTPIET